MSEDTSVGELKSMIEKAEGVLPVLQRLIYYVKDSQNVELSHGRNSPLAIWESNGLLS